MRYVLVCLALGACSDSLLPAGEHCSTSAECAAGLLCDTGKSPAVCGAMGSPHLDMSSSDDLAVAVQDLAGDDLSGVVLDLSVPHVVDLAMPAHDLSHPAHDL